MSILMLKEKVKELATFLDTLRTDDVDETNKLLMLMDEANSIMLQAIIPPPPVQPKNLPIIIYCDGGCLNNQDADKREAYGSFKIVEDGEIIGSNEKVPYGNKTNNFAEYFAMYSALEALQSIKKDQGIDINTVSVEIVSDSKLVVNQLRGDWKVNVPELMTLNLAVKERLLQFKHFGLTRVGREILVEQLGH